MAQNDYFSFGDEELESELDLDDLSEGHPDQAVALAEPFDGVPASEYELGSVAERAARPRGDSTKRSPEKRLPSSRRTLVLAALASGLLVLFLLRAAISGLTSGEPVAQSQANRSVTRRVAPSTAELEVRRADAVQASRQRAAERQRARRHKAQTRRRARRGRQRVKESRKRKTEPEAISSAPEAPAPEYVPPAYEPAPPASSPEPAPSPPSEDHPQDGAHSPEFGL
jgi:hypothetical protein